MKMRTATLCAALASAYATAAAIAGVHHPVPPYSTASWHGPISGGCSAPVLCPGGDAPAIIDIIAKAYFGQPILDVDPTWVSASGACALAAGSPCAQTVRIYSDGESDSKGHMTITIGRAGGSCSLLSIESYNPVLFVWEPFDSLSYTSVDPSGNLAVDIADVGFFADAFNSHKGEPRYNASVDFTCDDTVGLTDLGVLVEHYGHSCQ